MLCMPQSATCRTDLSMSMMNHMILKNNADWRNLKYYNSCYPYPWSPLYLKIKENSKPWHKGAVLLGAISILVKNVIPKNCAVGHFKLVLLRC